MSPLSPDEVADYVRHRIEVAGGAGKVTFSSAALSFVARSSGGIPRLINLVCDRALLAGYVEGTRSIETPIVRRAAREVRAPRPRRGGARRYLPLVAAAGVIALAAGLAARDPLAGTSAPQPASATPRPSPLEATLLSLPRTASLEGSVAAVRALWGPGPLQRTDLQTHMRHVRRLDLPVVLEMFHPERSDTCFVALLQLEGDQALVSTNGPPLRLPLAELDRSWTRRAVFLWRDAELLHAIEDPAAGVAWAERNLSRLGYLNEGPDLARAVTRFQRDTEIVPDGIIGTQTLLTLFSLGERSRPRLSGLDPSGGLPTAGAAS
jgi:general secretion pathway protein A